MREYFVRRLDLPNESYEGGSAVPACRLPDNERVVQVLDPAPASVLYGGAYLMALIERTVQ